MLFGPFFASLLLVFVVVLTTVDGGRRRSRRSGIYVDNGKGQTEVGKVSSTREFRRLQREMLKVLGIQRRPRPKAMGQGASSRGDKDDPASNYLMDVYRFMKDEDEHEYERHSDHHHHSSRSRDEEEVLKKSSLVISFRDKGQGEFGPEGKEGLLWFDTSQIPPGYELLKAELRMYKDGSNFTEPLRLEVQQMVPGWTVDDVVFQPIGHLNVSGHHAGWLQFDMTKAVREWLAFPQVNWGLVLSVEKQESAGETIAPESVGISDKPFLVCYFQNQGSRGTVAQEDEPRSRSRREEDAELPPVDNPYITYITVEQEKLCQRRMLYVSFHDLNWEDWIIAPEGYTAYFCSGVCTFPLHAHFNATNHAIAQTLFHLMYPTMYGPAVCTPTKLASVSVLYFDEDFNVILKKYANMVVKKCGCT